MTHTFDSISEPIAERISAGLDKLAIAMRAREWSAAEELGLKPTQSQILSYLRARAGGPERLTRLAEALAVSQPTASDSVAALVRKGLVEKRPNPKDGRAVDVILTTQGRKVSDRLAAWPDTLLQAADRLGEPEKTALLRTIVTLIRSLQIAGAIPVQRMCVTCRHFRPNVHTDPGAPHHCAFVDAAFGDQHLRLDCPDQDPAPAPEQQENWAQFTGPAP